MKILIVSASSTEIKEIRDKLTFINKLTPNLSTYKFGKLRVDLLITGYGSVFTAFYLTRTLYTNSYDLAVNAGVAGSFDYFLEQGFVVNVIRDQFADLGFEDKNGFYTLGEKEMLNFQKAAIAKPELITKLRTYGAQQVQEYLDYVEGWKKVLT